MLQSMGSQRVGYNIMTEQQQNVWTERRPAPLDAGSEVRLFHRGGSGSCMH